MNQDSLKNLWKDSGMGFILEKGFNVISISNELEISRDVITGMDFHKGNYNALPHLKNSLNIVHNWF